MLGRIYRKKKKTHEIKMEHIIYLLYKEVSLYKEVYTSYYSNDIITWCNHKKSEMHNITNTAHHRRLFIHYIMTLTHNIL